MGDYVWRQSVRLSLLVVACPFYLTSVCSCPTQHLTPEDKRWEQQNAMSHNSTVQRVLLMSHVRWCRRTTPCTAPRPHQNQVTMQNGTSRAFEKRKGTLDVFSCFTQTRSQRMRKPTNESLCCLQLTQRKMVGHHLPPTSTFSMFFSIISMWQWHVTTH